MIPDPHLVNLDQNLIAHSIGVPLARLFTHSEVTAPNPSHTHQIFALIALDSNPANTDLSALLPNPTSPEFSPNLLPQDTTFAQLLASRPACTSVFVPTAQTSQSYYLTQTPQFSALIPRHIFPYAS